MRLFHFEVKNYIWLVFNHLAVIYSLFPIGGIDKG